MNLNFSHPNYASSRPSQMNAKEILDQTIRKCRIIQYYESKMVSRYAHLHPRLNRFINEIVQRAVFSSGPIFFDCESHTSFVKNLILLASDLDYFARQNRIQIREKFDLEWLLDLTPSLPSYPLPKMRLSSRQKAMVKHIDPDLVYAIWLRLFLTGSGNMFCSVPPSILKLGDVECFASIFNHTLPAFCSMFPQLENSIGEFFTFEPSPKYRIYNVNPPYVEELMERMAHRLIQWLRGPIPIILYVTLPIWDSASQQKYNLWDYGKKFAAFEILTGPLAKEYYRCGVSLPEKDLYPYFDFGRQGNPRAPISTTHYLCLSNDSNFTIDESRQDLKRRVDMWREY